MAHGPFVTVCFPGGQRLVRFEGWDFTKIHVVLMRRKKLYDHRRSWFEEFLIN